MYQYPSTTSKSAATPLRRSAPSTDAAAPQEIFPQEMSLVSLMNSSSRSPTITRTFLPGGPAGRVHAPPDRDMVIGIIESVLNLIEDDDDEEEEKPKLRGVRRQ